MSDTTPKTRAQKPKSAAQRASDANRIMQHAVRTNTARPDDRQPHQKQEQSDHKTGFAPGRSGKD